MKKQLLLTFAILGGLVGLSTLATVGQEKKKIITEKSGRFHIGKSVLVGRKMLAAGMYQVQHADENEEHIVIFRKVEMGYRGNMGNQNLGAEVARVKCTVEEVDKKIRNTKILIHKSAAGEQRALEVWIRGEKIKHILPTP